MVPIISLRKRNDYPILTQQKSQGNIKLAGPKQTWGQFTEFHFSVTKLFSTEEFITQK